MLLVKNLWGFSQEFLTKFKDSFVKFCCLWPKDENQIQEEFCQVLLSVTKGWKSNSRRVSSDFTLCVEFSRYQGWSEVYFGGRRTFFFFFFREGTEWKGAEDWARQKLCLSQGILSPCRGVERRGIFGDRSLVLSLQGEKRKKKSHFLRKVFCELAEEIMSLLCSHRAGEPTLIFPTLITRAANTACVVLLSFVLINY